MFHGDLTWGMCMDQSFQFDVHCFAKHVGNVVYVCVIKLALNDPGWLQEAAANEAQVQFNDTVSTEAMKSATRQWMRHMDAAHVDSSGFAHMSARQLFGIEVAEHNITSTGRATPLGAKRLSLVEGSYRS